MRGSKDLEPPPGPLSGTSELRRNQSVLPSSLIAQPCDGRSVTVSCGHGIRAQPGSGCEAGVVGMRKARACMAVWGIEAVLIQYTVLICPPVSEGYRDLDEGPIFPGPVRPLRSCYRERNRKGERR